MISLIIYGSPKKLTNAHKPVHHASTPPPVNRHGRSNAQPQPEYFVRIKVFHGTALEAMDHACSDAALARSNKDEILLNTVQLD